MMKDLAPILLDIVLLFLNYRWMKKAEKKKRWVSATLWALMMLLVGVGLAGRIIPYWNP